MDGLELSEPIISGLEDGDELRGPIGDGLVDALNGVEDDAAASVRDRIMAPTEVEVAMLLYDHEDWGGIRQARSGMGAHAVRGRATSTRRIRSRCCSRPP